jgi:hypothetical protein
MWAGRFWKWGAFVLSALAGVATVATHLKEIKEAWVAVVPWPSSPKPPTPATLVVRGVSSKETFRFEQKTTVEIEFVAEKDGDEHLECSASLSFGGFQVQANMANYHFSNGDSYWRPEGLVFGAGHSVGVASYEFTISSAIPLPLNAKFRVNCGTVISDWTEVTVPKPALSPPP